MWSRSSSAPKCVPFSCSRAALRRNTSSWRKLRTELARARAAERCDTLSCCQVSLWSMRWLPLRLRELSGKAEDRAPAAARSAADEEDEEDRRRRPGGGGGGAPLELGALREARAAPRGLSMYCAGILFRPTRSDLSPPRFPLPAGARQTSQTLASRFPQAFADFTRPPQTPQPFATLRRPHRSSSRDGKPALEKVVVREGTCRFTVRKTPKKQKTAQRGLGLMAHRSFLCRI